jgi:DNA-binding transcriptional ArsR family regulator
MQSLDQTFTALAHPVRRAIIARLTQGEAPVKELIDRFPISPPAITKHLHVLEQAGLIVRGRDAQRRPCRLNSAPLEEVARWVAEYRRFWDESFDRLEQYVATLQSHDKTGERKTKNRKPGKNKGRNRDAK